jgi:MoxR-like ATPase
MLDTKSAVIVDAREGFLRLKDRLNDRIIGQKRFVDHLLIAVIANGHLLVEGLPGLAKTTAIKYLAEGVEGDFHRIQFTPDLLPSDITGTEVFLPQDGQFTFQPGPIFKHFVLADEINRAPAKVQSALLEAMGERQVTIGQKSYRLPNLFMVMATQNPIENAGTYALPEAQLDRFLMHVCLDYPEKDSERAILAHARGEQLREQQANPRDQRPCLTQKLIFSARRSILQMHMSEAVESYIIALVLATRDASSYDKDLAKQIAYGVSPRATIALDVAARASAWLKGRDFVSPEDVHDVVTEVFRHRIILSLKAQSQGQRSEDVIMRLLQAVPIP